MQAETDKRPPGRPRDPRADQAIMAAALELLAELGTDATSIDAVAARAQVARSTVYRRWASKEQVLMEALRALASTAKAPHTGSVRGDLLLLAGQFHALLSGSLAGRLFPQVLKEIKAGSPLGRRYAELVIAPRRRLLAEALRAGVERRELRSDTDVEAMINSLVGPILVAHLLAGVGIRPPKRLVEQTVDVLLDGVGTAGNKQDDP